MSQAISKRRLKDILPDSVEGTPDYWYGVVDGFAGSLWSELFPYYSKAKERADELEGQVVVVAARILEDEEGEQIEPSN